MLPGARLDSALSHSSDVVMRDSSASCLFFRISATVTMDEMAIPSADSCTSPCSCRNLCNSSRALCE